MSIEIEEPDVMEKDKWMFNLTLLRSGTVAMGHKSMWPQATSPSLLKRCYSGSSVATDRRRPSLLWLIVVMGVLTPFT
jgi:hypothetical protein